MGSRYPAPFKLFTETEEEESKYQEVLEMLYGPEQEATISEIERRFSMIYMAITREEETQEDPISEIERRFSMLRLDIPQETRSNSSIELNDKRLNSMENRSKYYGEKSSEVYEFDFDLHEEFPNGQTLLHYIVAYEDFSYRISNFLLSEGLDVNKKDNFGRTPLYYLLASFNRHVPRRRLEIFLLCGAKVNIPKGDTHFYYFNRRRDMVADLFCNHMHIIATNPSIDYRKEGITDDIRNFVANILRCDNPDRKKWFYVLTGLEKLFVSDYYNYLNGLDIFSYFYCLIEDVCLDLGIEMQLFHPENRKAFFLLMAIVRSVEILKFLISKGVDMNGLCLDSSYNFLDHCIRYSNFETVEFLASIGIRPKGSLDLLTDENSGMDPKIKKIVKDTCSQLSLKNMCRLRINKSLKVDKAVKKVPRVIGDFIRFEK